MGYVGVVPGAENIEGKGILSQVSLGRRFVFAVPLKARSACSDWEQAQANLRQTLRSAQQAGAGQAVAIVACHDEPDLRDLRGPDVQVLRVPFPEPDDPTQGTPSQGGRDKAKKRRFIGAWLREALVEDEVYVMFLDADDLVHRDLVRHVLGHPQKAFLVDKGYALDVTDGLLQHWRQSFHHACGSSFVCWFARDELPTSWEDVASPFSQFGTSPDQRGHPEYDRAAADLGRPPAPFPFPAVVYLVHHAESFREAKGGGRRRTSPRDLIRPASARKILNNEFSAPEAAQQLAGAIGFAKASVKSSGQRVRARLARTASPSS